MIRHLMWNDTYAAILTMDREMNYSLSGYSKCIIK